MTTETIDRLPHGWIVADICKRQPRSREWVALVTEADPRDVPYARAAWVRIPGQHRTRPAAWEALAAAYATRH
jgi:hypothetical protein